MPGQGDRPRGPEGDQERDRDLRLPDRQAPGDGGRQPAGDDPRPAVPDATPNEGQQAGHDETRLPHERGCLKRQERERPKRDREQRRIPVEAGLVRGRGLLIQRQTGVEPRTGVVIGADVGQGIFPEMQGQGVQTDDQAKDGGRDQHPLDPSSTDQTVQGGHIEHRSGRRSPGRRC